MLNSLKTGAAVRALLTTVPLGAGAGAMLAAVLGGAFLAGGMAKDAVVNTRAVRVADTMSMGITDASLSAILQSDPSVLSLALRHDPFMSASDAPMSRQERALSEALQARLSSGQPMSVRTAVANPAAQPWRANPLDEARQMECLSDAVYYEARGESPAGQAAVAQVVLNRVRHSAFPKSICAVVYQGAQSGRCQFSFACNGAMRANKEPGAWARAQRVAERALGGHVLAEVGNATHFHTTSVRPGWHNLVQVANIGTHVFYRFGGRTGAPGAFTEEPQAETTYALAVRTIEPVEVSVEPVPASIDTPAQDVSAAPAAVIPAAAAPAPAGQSAPRA